MKFRLFANAFTLAIASAVSSPSIAQPFGGQLQEEGVEPTLEQVLRGQAPDPGNPRYVQAYRDALMTATKRELATPEKIDDLIFKSYGVVSPAKAKLIERNIRAIMTNEGFYDMLVNLTLPMLGAGVSIKQFNEVVVETVGLIPAKGLYRLEERDQMAFVAYTARLMGTIPAEICKLIALSEITLKQSAYVERGYLSTRSDEEFETVADLYLRSIEAELSSTPAPTFTDSQKSAAETVFADALVKRMSKRMHIGEASRILNNMKSSSADEVCEATLDIFRTLMDMPAPFRKWQIQAFLAEAAK